MRYVICTVLARCHVIEVKHSNKKKTKNKHKDLIMCWSLLFLQKIKPCNTVSVRFSPAEGAISSEN